MTKETNLIKEFLEAYEDMEEDGEMRVIMCKCGTIYFCGTHGEYSPGVFNCISPTNDPTSISIHKINSRIEIYQCKCGEILTCSYYDEEHKGGPDHFEGNNITMLKEFT